jgi:5-formyltetrahydrofolate cyclo-ligase
MQPTKQQLRTQMRAARSAIPDRAERTPALWDSVVRHCHEVGAHIVMAFVGVGSEPDTSGLIERLAGDGFLVALPRVEDDCIVAVVHDIADRTGVLTPGRYGIPAPLGPPIDPTTIDVVIVPGLAFTRDGRRLGQGGGFYDRFLPSLGERCVTIGVCFAEQIVDDLVTEPHDQYLDIVLTDAVQE